MSVFGTLFKYELKKQFPFLQKKNRLDIIGLVLSLIITLAIAGLFVYFLSIITKAYVGVKIDKVSDPIARAYEIANVFYSVILVIFIFISLENMRKVFADGTDKKVLLQLPVKEQDLFLTKFLVLMIKNYLMSLLFIVPTSLIISLAIAPSWVFWLMTFAVWLLMPLVAFLFSGILIIPYIKLINFIKDKYILIFILLSVLVAAFVLLYVSFLGVVQGYLETGYIKFLMNAKFVSFLQTLLKWTYPANCFAGMLLFKDLLKSCLVVIGCAIASCFLVVFVAKRLYYITLYRDENITIAYRKHIQTKERSVLGTLINKEFISVSREPKHIFSYLVIATIMPILTYCCFTLLESLTENMIGIQVPFALALFIVLVFSVLTNTFCATNITRDGATILMQKTLPVKASQIMLAKVMFCLFVSLASVIVSCVVLVAATSLTIGDGLICLLIAILFTIAQILVATKLDLNSVKMPSTKEQSEQRSSATVAKVVFIGLLLAVAVGLFSLIISFFANGGLISAKIHVDIIFAYIIPVVIGVMYLGFASWYYFSLLQKSLDKISK